MSTIHVEVVEVLTVKPHPNADRLEIVEVLGTQCCAPIGKFKLGQLAIWFPPGILLREPVSEKLGVTQYLKHSQFPEDTVKSKCRVAACRMRGVPSFGFLVTPEEAIDASNVLPLPPSDDDGLVIPFSRLVLGNELQAGFNVSGYFGAVKYEPPKAGTPGIPRPKAGTPGIPRPKGFNADAAPDNDRFHKYTDIEHFYKNARVLEDGEEVVITEKLHGSNIRFGLCRNDDGEFEFLCGSHKVNWKEVDAKGNTPIWWQMLNESLMALLTDLCDEQNDVVAFGEIFGPGVQDMDYGVGEELAVRLFSVTVNRRHLDFHDFRVICSMHGVEIVPILYLGPFSKAKLQELTDGPTTLASADQLRSKFKGREGCVVTPVIERAYYGGRVIFKSVSADYLDRKDQQDN